MKYRKVDPRIWNDEKFRALTHDGKLLFLFLLTHPHMTSVGAMRASLVGMADELEMDPKAFREAFGEAFRKGLVEVDEKARFVGLPNFIKYNRPESPNVLRAWAGAFELLPECKLKVQLFQRVKAFAEGFGEGFAKAFREAFGQPSPNPEPEPEPEQEQEFQKDNNAREAAGPVDPPPGAEPDAVDWQPGMMVVGGKLQSPPADLPPPRPSRPIPPDWSPNDNHRSAAAAAGLDLDDEATVFRAHYESQPKSSANWDAEFTKWLTRSKVMARNASAASRASPKRRGGYESRVERQARIDREFMHGDREDREAIDITPRTAV